jgi:hypothetical protein
VWWIERGEWHKQNAWGQASSYGKVHRSKQLDVRKYQRLGLNLKAA